ncbi:MAG: CCA tRNA nucleotidyltransferase [Nitrospirae bacterium]|nr:MAG: CCA tRNA nucleotidyltransferase [Nitrospirota bacterium]
MTMLFPATHGRNLRKLMRDRLPAKVFKRLEDAGRLAGQSGVSAFVVGGLVRDLLLGHTTIDVDIAVEGDGMAFAGRLADRHGAALKIFERFATAYVVFPDGFKLDVATARGESYAHPTALPAVKPSSLEKDLYRRDFTINALAIDLNGRHFGDVIDYYGGLHDLKAKTIRVLHDRSFVDDPTRLFRAIRFEQRFGFHLDANTLGLLRQAAATDLVHRLSGPRLRNEVMALLAEQDPRRTIRRMAGLDLLRFIHPAVTLTPQLSVFLSDLHKALAWWAKQFPGRPVDRALVYFMNLTERLDIAATDAVLKRLALPNRQADKVRTVKERLASTSRVLARRRALKPSQAYRLFAALPDEGFILLAARTKSSHVKRLLTAHVTPDRHVKPSLTGEDLKKMGLKPGPLYGKILDRLLDARLDGQVASEDQERDLAKKIANALGG